MTLLLELLIGTNNMMFVACHHVRSLILDRPLYIWNKDNAIHFFIEVDSSDEGWGACTYQYTDSTPLGEDEGKHFLLSKRPKRIIQWISKAWADPIWEEEPSHILQRNDCANTHTGEIPQPHRNSSPWKRNNMLLWSPSRDQKHVTQSATKASYPLGSFMRPQT